MKKPTPEQLQIMADQRCASLIKRWLASKKLAEDDLAFVSTQGHIPIELLRAGPSAPGAKEAVTGALKTRKHAKYPKKLPEYASLYGQTDRTIKRWIRRGKELGDLPPLDSKEQMAAWWRRCMDQQVPDYLLAIEPSGGAPDPTSGKSDEEKSTTPRDFSDVKSLDIAQNVEALRQSHAINAHLLNEALRDPEANEQAIALRQRNYERSFELLRKAEQTLIDLQKQRGNLIDQESVRVELAQLFESLRLMRETMPRRILAEIERMGVALVPGLQEHLAAAVEKVRAQEDEIFRKLETLDGPEALRKLLAA